MIPAAPINKPKAYFDTECYINYWLLKFRIKNGPKYTFEIGMGETLSPAQCQQIRWLFDNFTVVSFNGIYYDVAMIAAALGGYDTQQLKWQSDAMIVEQLKPWELPVRWDWQPSDHIDLINVAPGDGSLKQYAGRIHCKRMRDLPYPPETVLTTEQRINVAEYCEHDLHVLEALDDALEPQMAIRILSSAEYGIDLRSKSDAQAAEAIIKSECERLLGQRIFKAEIDFNLRFRYEPPTFLSFQLPQLQKAFSTIQESIFGIGANGAVEMPVQLEGLSVGIGSSVYKMGIGGLHSSEKRQVYRTTATHVLRDADVASYYPRLILNSGKFPKALGEAFREVFSRLIDSRLLDKELQKSLEKRGFKGTVEWVKARASNEGKKIFINGTFGKTNSMYSILFAPEMFIQTVITGQLSLLMLIEQLEMNAIPVVSANTDGIVMHCPRKRLALADAIIKEWERRTGLEMEVSDYQGLYNRDVNNYFAVKTNGEVKRKGQYSKAGLIEKKNPFVEICGDAVEAYLKDGTPILYTIAMCRDLRKFINVRMVAGGAVKLWGEMARKETKVVDMTPTLLANGWQKKGRAWTKDGINCVSSRTAYETCFAAPTEEYVGKVIRFYYSTIAPGPIVNGQGHTTSLSYGGRPCMELPDEFPDDIDYEWYETYCNDILEEIGALAA